MELKDYRAMRDILSNAQDELWNALLAELPFMDGDKVKIKGSLYDTRISKIEPFQGILRVYSSTRTETYCDYIRDPHNEVEVIYRECEYDGELYRRKLAGILRGLADRLEKKETNQ